MSAIGESEHHSPEGWRRIRAIFDEVQAFPLDQRPSLLEDLCEGDGELLQELESLLEASDAEEELAENFSDASETTSHPGRIGPYEIDRLLGRGGMGAVYLAHRADGHFDQQLAIKLIDAPLASDLFRKQFRMERQILAGLSHPFIARLLDGGVTGNGELYLAMEYVDGESILNYCKQKHLSLRDRLSLFINVCSAVQYAHQNLVIHRDLKPDNILVVESGTPRLLDFGTAKLVTPFPEDSASDLTLHGLRSFTPQYASPEQVLGQAISTASDIYSLGVILFHLLADVPPYLLKEFNTEEMLRVICVEQPPKPSAVAVSAEKPDADLDSIVLMALRKEPDERYLTVDKFGADVQAWLDGRPVIARRGTLRYRAIKFTRRNKVGLGAGVLLAASLLCGIAGVLWQSRVANLQRIRAEENAEVMRDFSNSFLSEIDTAVSELPGSTPVRRLMVQRVLDHLDKLAQYTNGDRASQAYLANAYFKLGTLQGNFYVKDLGDAPGALVSLNKAFTITQALRASHPKDLEMAELSASILKTRCAILWGIGRPQDAVDSVRAAIKILETVESQNRNTSLITQTARAYHVLGDVLGEPETPSLGDYPAALDAYRKSSDLYRRALAASPDSAEVKRGIATNHLSVGNILRYVDPESAIDELRQGIALWDTIPVADRSDVTSRRTILYLKITLAKSLMFALDYKAAVSTLEEARSSIEKGAAADPQDSQAQTDLAGILGDEADAYIDMLNPLLNPETNRTQQIRWRAAEFLRRAISVNQKLVAIDRNNQMWVADLAYEKVLLGTLEDQKSSRLAASGTAELRRLASAKAASSEVLYRAAVAGLVIRPKRLRDAGLTVQYADRLVALSHRTDPTSLLLLAQAYSADGQQERARTTAREALGLLPPRLPDARAVRCRVLLEEMTKNSSTR